MKYKFHILIILVFSAIMVSLVIFFQEKKDSSKKEPQKTQEQPQEKIGEEKKTKEHPDAILKMAEKEFSGGELSLVRVLDDNPIYTRHHITYRSEGLKISGIMNIPKGDGPFPVLILNHGYIDPKIYTNGQGLKREQDFFAGNGYAVLHSDYRDHAQSDFDPENEIRPRAGYVEDVINAISAVKKSNLDMLDKNSIGMLGHSMGGGVTINVMVTKPDVAKAYVLLAPINSDYKVNFKKWVLPGWSKTAEEFIRLYGTPEENPELWDTLSAKNYLSRVTSPIMLHQGAKDAQVPVEWSRELKSLLEKEDKEIQYFEYPQEDHVFANAQEIVMQRTLEFFDEHLKR
jgi:uncharacterized protein